MISHLLALFTTHSFINIICHDFFQSSSTSNVLFICELGTDSFVFVSQILRLYVNIYVNTVDEEDYKLLKLKASTMDLGDMSVH